MPCTCSLCAWSYLPDVVVLCWLLIGSWMVSQADVLIRVAQVTEYSHCCSHSQDNKAYQLQNNCLIAIVILLGFLFKILCTQKKLFMAFWAVFRLFFFLLSVFYINHIYVFLVKWLRMLLPLWSNFPEGPRLPKARAHLTRMCT